MWVLRYQNKKLHVMRNHVPAQIRCIVQEESVRQCWKIEGAIYDRGI